MPARPGTSGGWETATGWGRRHGFALVRNEAAEKDVDGDLKGEVETRPTIKAFGWLGEFEDSNGTWVGLGVVNFGGSISICSVLYQCKYHAMFMLGIGD